MEIHSYFDNVMTKFMINNRTDAWQTDVNLLSQLSPLTIYLVSSLLLTVVTHFVAFSWVPGLSKMSANQSSPTSLLILTVRQHSIKILQTCWKKNDVCSDRTVICKLLKEFSWNSAIASDCTFSYNFKVDAVPVFRFFEYVNFERKQQKINSTS